jgi:hypothetical protein
VKSRPLSSPRPLRDLDGNTAGQLLTEWVLVTAVIVIPIILLIPMMLEMMRIYFYRVAEVISLPFP